MFGAKYLENIVFVSISCMARYMSQRARKEVLLCSFLGGKGIH